MKLILFFIILACLKVPAAAYAQTITLNEKNASLAAVLKKIEEQSKFSVFYENDLLKQSRPVSINIVNASLSEALDKCFTNQLLTYYIVDQTIVVKIKNNAVIKPGDGQKPPVKIKGKVVNPKNQSLQGVSIKIKGGTQTFLTDKDGAFVIEVPNEDAILVFSYVGFETQEISVGSNLRPLITLKETVAQLEELSVVSTGYQTIPKERATGSFTIVNKQLYNQQVGPDILSRLEFIANGVSVFRNTSTRTSQIMVRGLSTINGPTSPLIVIDNFPYEGDLKNINPNDVESVTVLKDAAAASIWGARAGNGVIVVTTKKGSYNQPLRIEVSSNATVGRKPDMNYLTTMSSSDYIDFEQYLYSKGYFNNQITSTRRPVLSPVVELLTKASGGVITNQQAAETIKTLRNLDVRDDYAKYIYQRSVNQQYYLNLNGGNEQLAYLFSGGYDKVKSTLSDNYNKVNIRSQVAFRPLKRLQFTASLQYTSSNDRTGKSGYGSIAPLAPYQMLADSYGQALPIPQTYRQDFKDQVAAGGLLQDWNYYPLSDFKHNYSKLTTQDVVANFSANYQILDGLVAEVRYGFDKQLTSLNRLMDLESYFARNLINSFAQVTGSTVKNPIPLGGINDLQNGNLMNNNFRGQLNYTRDFKKHSISVLAGEEIRELKNTSNLSRSYGYSNDLLSSSGVDYLTFYPNYATKVTARIPYSNTFNATTTRFVSFFANGAYTYNAKYTVSGSIRRDASNLFGVATNDKWTPLWSAGLSWDISKEGFYKLNFLPFVKLRGTYGSSGNVDPSRSAVTTISYYSSNSPYTNTPFSSIENFSNPELRWEKVKTLNFGLDFKVKNNRITGSFDYYNKRATDLYAPVAVDYSAGLGVASITKNAASIEASGVDIELNSVNVEKEVKWYTTINFNYYRERTTKYYLPYPSAGLYTINSKNPVEGHPVWSVYSFKYAGLNDKGDPQGYLNGSKSTDYFAMYDTDISELVYNGPRMPVYYGSLGNTITYNGLSLSIRATYGFGSYFRRTSIDYSALAISARGNSDYAKRWQKPGDENKTNVPSITYPLNSSRDNFYNSSEILVEKADCIRLQYINLNYELTRKQIPWLPAKGVNVYVVGNNLGILWRANKHGIDPDFNNTDNGFPTSMNIAFGIRASFTN